MCAGNSLVPGEFPAQRPVTRGFDVLFDLRLQKRLSIQSWPGDLRRHRAHYDVIVMKAGKRFLSVFLAFYEAGNTELCCFVVVQLD